MNCDTKYRQAVLGTWRGEDSFYICFGFDNWMTTPRDRLAGRKVKHEIALSSVHHQEIVNPSLQNASKYELVRAYQDMTWFLTASIRHSVLSVTRDIQLV